MDYPTSTDMVVKEGSNVTLKCSATGSPPPTIMFRREDGEPIKLPGGVEGNVYIDFLTFLGNAITSSSSS